MSRWGKGLIGHLQCFVAKGFGVFVLVLFFVCPTFKEMVQYLQTPPSGSTVHQVTVQQVECCQLDFLPLYHSVMSGVWCDPVSVRWLAGKG